LPSNVPKHRRLVYVALAIIAVAVASIVVSNRATPRPQSTPTMARAVQTPQVSSSGGAAESAPATRRGTASTYFVDPTTGLPREPTPEELLDLQQQLDPTQQTARPSEEPQPFTTDTGFTGLRLSDDQMTYTVATRNANGSVTLSHAQGRKAADRVVKDAAQGGIRAGKEQRLER
jgi:hypothetical protein